MKKQSPRLTCLLLVVAGAAGLVGFALADRTLGAYRYLVNAALFVCFGWFAFDRTRQRAGWAKVAILCVGSFGALVSLGILCVDAGWIELTSTQAQFVKNTVLFVYGILLGLVLAMVAAGQIGFPPRNLGAR